ncbi:hypothetical protein ENBRE01_3006 [Enteropsectra breve]|nr:hypothetical protein ENBRE01_3006 [Enteropsectra breve]
MASIKDWVENEVPLNYHIIADSAFPAAFNCLVPIKGNLTLQDKIFNNMISRQRMTVESTIGHFKSKFAKFSTRIRNGEKTFYKKLSYSCAVIHNILIDFKINNSI